MKLTEPQRAYMFEHWPKVCEIPWNQVDTKGPLAKMLKDMKAKARAATKPAAKQPAKPAKKKTVAFNPYATKTIAKKPVAKKARIDVEGKKSYDENEDQCSSCGAWVTTGCRCDDSVDEDEDDDDEDTRGVPLNTKFNSPRYAWRPDEDHEEDERIEKQIGKYNERRDEELYEEHLRKQEQEDDEDSDEMKEMHGL